MPRSRIARSRFTEQECLQAILDEESRLGRPLTPRERVAFAQGFHSTEYREEVRRLMAWEVRHGGGES
jgi:arsenate reductase-like glutaredoxin family protein